MAKAAVTDKSDKAERKPSLLSALLPVALLTIMAGGGGFAFGSLVVTAKHPITVEAEPAPQENAEGSHGTTGEEPAAAAENPEQGAIVRRLTPIITNLQAPKQAWIRLEAAVVLKAEAAHEQDLLAVEAQDRILGFLRSVNLADIEGPSGFLHLRDDLNDLLAGDPAAMVTRVLISSMVVE
jgi:flagellar protein FliL